MEHTIQNNATESRGLIMHIATINVNLDMQSVPCRYLAKQVDPGAGVNGHDSAAIYTSNIYSPVINFTAKGRT